MSLRAITMVALLLGGLTASAQDTIFYKCTDAAGKTSLQNGTPCAPGMKQEIRRVGEIRTAPLPKRRDTPPPEPPPPAYGEFVLVSGPSMRKAKPDPAAADRPPPPPLYQCKTWQGDTYLGEQAQPPPRCMPLQIVGVDGSAGTTQGSACEMKDDECSAIDEAQLCVNWLRRLDEADFRRNHTSAQDRYSRQAEYQRVRGLIAASRCATPELLAPAAQP